MIVYLSSKLENIVSEIVLKKNRKYIFKYINSPLEICSNDLKDLFLFIFEEQNFLNEWQEFLKEFNGFEKIPKILITNKNIKSFDKKLYLVMPDNISTNIELILNFSFDSFMEKNFQIKNQLNMAKLSQSMAHDIKSPLLAVVTYLEILKEDYKCDEDVFSKISNCLKSIDQSLKSFNHFYNSKIQCLSIKKLEVRNYILEILKEFDPIKISIQFEGQGNIYADPEYFYGAFKKLLSNLNNKNQKLMIKNEEKKYFWILKVICSEGNFKFPDSQSSSLGKLISNPMILFEHYLNISQIQIIKKQPDEIHLAVPKYLKNDQ